MGLEFNLDRELLDRAMRESPQLAGKGAASALRLIKDDWVAESVDVAPIDTSNLRKQINAEVINPGNQGRVEIRANTTRGSKRFNYAYYIHEQDAGGKSVNGEKKFLDKTAEENLDKWSEWLEEEVRKKLKKAGW